MSKLTQFFNFSPVDNRVYDNTEIGEIKIFPETIVANTFIESNNYVRARSVLSQSEYPGLFNLIGRTSAYPLTPKTIGGAGPLVKRFDPSVSANVFYTHYQFDIRKISANGYFAETIATLPFRNGSSDEYAAHSFTYSKESGYFLTAGELGNLARSTDAITWQIASNTATETQNRFNSITYGNGVYVAVGSGDHLFRYSTDFIKWDYFPNIRANNTSAILASTYGNGVFLQGGNDGFIQSSTDGYTWTTRTSGTTSTINGLTYGNGIFVLVGNGGTLRTSADGITWTARTPGTTSNIRAVIYGNSRWVWCGDTGAIGYGTSSTSWATASSGTTTNLTAITYGNGIFLAAGIAATTLTSTNGVSWTLRLNSTAGTYVGSTEYMSPGTYSWVAPANVTSVSVVCVGGGAGAVSVVNDNTSIYSNDHVYYSGAGGGLGWKNNISVVPGNTYTVVVGNAGQGAYRYWSESYSWNLSTSYGQTSYFDNVNLVAGGGGGWNSPSSTPSSWQYQNYSGPAERGGYIGDGGGQGGQGHGFSINAFEFSPWSMPTHAGGGGAGGYSGTGGFGVRVYTANNVIFNNSNWYGQPDTNSGAGSGGYGSSWGGGVGIFGKGVDGNSASGFGGSGGSNDGIFGGGGPTASGQGRQGAVRIIWGTGRSYPSTATGNLATVSAGGDPAVSLTYGNGVFVYTSELGRYLTSTDGITWLSRNPPSTVTIRSSIYGNGKYFYGDDTGAIYYNTNLANTQSWIRSSNSTIDRINTITYGNSKYIFAGSNTTQNGRSIVSTNGFVGLNIKYAQSWETNYRVAFYDPIRNTFAIAGQYRKDWSQGSGISQVQDPYGSSFRYSPDGYSWFPNVDMFKYYGADRTEPYRTDIYSIESVIANTLDPANNRTLIMVGASDVHGSFGVYSNTLTQSFEGGFRAIPNSSFQTANTVYRVRQPNPEVYQQWGGNSLLLFGNGNYIAQGSISQWGLSIGLVKTDSSPMDGHQKDDGGYIVSQGSWSGYMHLTSNNFSTIEYAPSYNVQTQFIVPAITGILQKENYGVQGAFGYGYSTSVKQSDYVNTANNFYESVFVRTK